MDVTKAMTITILARCATACVSLICAGVLAYIGRSGWYWGWFIVTAIIFGYVSLSTESKEPSKGEG